ncbi:MAG: ABC transporter ATP-binding protein [Planctomycetia bacterium]|nr:ABC transporter ATP-binding protein [Planctomycetia bacterium]
MATALELNHVWKKFHRGEFNDCLRDAIPTMVKGLFGFGPRRDELAAKDFWALKDIDFKVEEGETLGIIGHNGAGKSTLLKILSNIIAPNRGSMRVNGRLRSLIEVGAGFHGDLTGRENIYLNGAILGMTRQEIQKNFDSIVDFSGIEDFLDMPVKRYSSGMAARLGFAVAAHLEPEVLIVDEVLSVGDAQFQKKCLGKMNDVAASGRTVLFVSHNMSAVKNLCQRAILLQRGEMVVDGRADEVIHEYIQSVGNPSTDLSNRKSYDGSGEVRFTKFLLQGLRTQTNVIGLGEGVRIELHFHVNKPVEDFELYISVWDENDINILQFNSRDVPQPIKRLDRDGYFCFETQMLPLAPRNYRISALIMDGRGAIDRVLHIDDLTVEGERFGQNVLLRAPYAPRCLTDFSFHLIEAIG